MLEVQYSYTFTFKVALHFENSFVNILCYLPESDLISLPNELEVFLQLGQVILFEWFGNIIEEWAGITSFSKLSETNLL